MTSTTKQMLVVLIGIVYGIYSIIVGWLNLKHGKKIIHVISYIRILITRILKGKEFAERQTEELVISSQLLAVSRYSIITGLMIIFLAIYAANQYLMVK